MQAWIAGLLQKTGRTLEEWIELVQDEGPETERERRAWLKAEHGLGTNASWWIAERAEGRAAEDGDPAAYLKAAEGYVKAMFAGKKSGLKPIYEKILEIARGLGCRREGLPLQDDRAPLSSSRLRRDQAVGRQPDRSRLRPGRDESDGPARGDRGLREEGPDHPPDPDQPPCPRSTPRSRSGSSMPMIATSDRTTPRDLAIPGSPADRSLALLPVVRVGRHRTRSARGTDRNPSARLAAVS